MRLKPGVEIFYKKKRYVKEIPDAVFDEMYKENDERKKTAMEKYRLVDDKLSAKMTA